MRRVLHAGEQVVLKERAAGRGGAGRHMRLLRALQGVRHVAIARVIDGGVAREGRPVHWFATCWVPGTAALESVRAGGLEPRHVATVVGGVAAGLARLHAAGVIHRDVAPGNVILTPAGEGVLIDFGHAVLVADALPASAGVVGTPGYVAPEEVLHGPAAVTTAVDVYGLAAVGYALLTGAAPAAGEDVLDALAGAGRPPPRPSDLGIDVAPALEAALLAALAPDPSDRPTAATLAAALADLGGPSGPRTPA